MKNAAPKMTVSQMDQAFVAYCAANGWSIESRTRACGGSMYYELNHSAVWVSGVSEIRISDHAHKYGDPSYSVGDDSFDGLFIFLQNELNRASMKCLSLQIASQVSKFAA
jgi:hypothetical protein